MAGHFLFVVVQLLACALLTSVTVVAQESAQLPADRDASAVNLAPREFGGENTTDQPEQARKDGADTRWFDPAAVTAIATSIMAIATVVILFVYRAQWHTMRTHAKYMREGLMLTQRAAETAKASADVAQASLSHAMSGYVDLKIIAMAVTDEGGPHKQVIQANLFNASRNPIELSGFEVWVRIRPGAWQIRSRRRWPRPEWMVPNKGFLLPIPVGQVSREQEALYQQQLMAVDMKVDVVINEGNRIEKTQTFTYTAARIGPDESKEAHFVVGGMPESEEMRAEVGGTGQTPSDA